MDNNSHQIPPQLAFGANIPPELQWQEGRTAGEISLIQFVQRTREYLNLPSNEEGEYLRDEATRLLQWIGVEK
jgi:hypothetical protein